MRPTEIKRKKIKNKLTSTIKFFMKDLFGKEITPDNTEAVKRAYVIIVMYAINVGWI